jgi:hypothetical protein
VPPPYMVVFVPLWSIQPPDVGGMREPVFYTPKSYHSHTLVTLCRPIAFEPMPLYTSSNTLSNHRIHSRKMLPKWYNSLK